MAAASAPAVPSARQHLKGFPRSPSLLVLPGTEPLYPSADLSVPAPRQRFPDGLIYPHISSFPSSGMSTHGSLKAPGEASSGEGSDAATVTSLCRCSHMNVHLRFPHEENLCPQGLGSLLQVPQIPVASCATSLLLACESLKGRNHTTYFLNCPPAYSQTQSALPPCSSLWGPLGRTS